MSAATKLENALREYILEIRQDLSKREGIHRFNFYISCEGRPDSDTLVEFKLGLNYLPDVVSGDASVLLNEAITRHHFSTVHKPLCIGVVE